MRDADAAAPARDEVAAAGADAAAAADDDTAAADAAAAAAADEADDAPAAAAPSAATCFVGRGDHGELATAIGARARSRSATRPFVRK